MTWQILQGDSIEIMRGLEPASVHCLVTSPPYWNLRDYGIEGQIGLEKTPEAFIDKMVSVFQEARRVLRDDGVCWINIGDSFTGLNMAGAPWRVALALQADGWILRRDNIWSKPNPMPESVNGWRWEQCRVKVAGSKRATPGSYLAEAPTGPVGGGRKPGIGGYEFDSRATWEDCPGCPKCDPHGGYVLRKGSGRCTTAHEYVFQFVKTGEYYYDCEAVKESSGNNTHSRGTKLNPPREHEGIGHEGWAKGTALIVSERNRRSVWEIATQPYPEAHFATYPPALVRPCIKAGSSAKGCCPACGSPWARVLDDSPEAKARLGAAWHDHQDDLGRGQRGAPPALKGPAKITLGWRPTCSCDAGDPVPCTVFDPFTGSGTTGEVAVELGRDFIGAELNPKDIELSRKRIGKAEERGGMATETTPLDGPVQMGLKL